MSRAYVPINCEFHDVLEATALRGRTAAIRHCDAGGRARLSHARIVDLHARNGEEYAQLDDGSRLRLDRITHVDGIPASAFGAACALPA